MADADKRNPKPDNERITERTAVLLCAAVAVVAGGISWVALGAYSDATLTLSNSAPRPAFPFVAGSVWSVTVSLWDWLSDSWDELDWFDAEREIVAEVIAELEQFGGVTVEDVDGNELDPDDLPDPNAPDGGSDCVICIDQDFYPTSRGFQWVRTRIANIVAKILEDL